MYELKIRAFWPGHSFSSCGEGKGGTEEKKNILRKDSHPAGSTPHLMFTIPLKHLFPGFLRLLCTHTPTSFASLGLGSYCFLHEVMFETFQLSSWPLLSPLPLFPVCLLGAAVLIGNGPTGKLSGYAESWVRKTYIGCPQLLKLIDGARQIRQGIFWAIPSRQGVTMNRKSGDLRYSSWCLSLYTTS